MMKHSAFLISAVLSLGVATVAGCSDDPTYINDCPRVEPAAECTTAVNYANELSLVAPGTVHTGWNGRDTYRAVLSANFGQFELESMDTDIVCAARLNCPQGGQQDNIALLTTQGPGNTTVTVTSNEQTYPITVEVTSYTLEEYDLGATRYLNPVNANGTSRQACGNCHLGQGGAPHTPLSLSIFSDAELISAASTSKYPDTCENDDGVLCNCVPSGGDCSACSQTCTFNAGFQLSLDGFGGGPGDHVFDLTPDEEVGIMAYMRAIDL